MMQLGFTPDYKGFSYLRSAVETALADPDSVSLVTKLVYIPLAKEYSTTPENIEKSIRKAADALWSRTESGHTVTVLGGTYTFTSERPGNRELISIIVRFVKESVDIFDTHV